MMIVGRLSFSLRLMWLSGMSGVQDPNDDCWKVDVLIETDVVVWDVSGARPYYEMR
jgi:hypothetical protein